MNNEEPTKICIDGYAFMVEVRATGRPIPMGDTIIGESWVPLPLIRVFRNALGITGNGQIAEGASPAMDSLEDALTSTHGHYAAMSLATCALSMNRYNGLEARLVEYKREITWTLTRTDELPLDREIDLCVDRAIARREKQQSSEGEKHV